MDSLALSPFIKSSQASAVSPDGKHVATLNDFTLEIRLLASLQLLREIKLQASSLITKFVCLRWSPIAKGAGTSNRILLSNENVARVWDIQDDGWSATIENGTAGMGKVANVEFGADDTEVLVFSEFGSIMTVWSLWNGQSISEIRDPKFATKGFGRNRNGTSSTFAILTRKAAQDSLNILAAGSYGVLNTIFLPTMDAQGLKWSPDGRWIAVWDTASSGYKVLIYTADGNLYRTYSGDYYDDALVGLGVKCVEWCPSGDFLAIAGFESTLTLLTTRTFSPAVHLNHIPSITLATGQVWQEQASSQSRYYSIAAQPAHPPAAQSNTPESESAPPKIGTSILGFNADGSLLVTKHDSMPTAAWIWDLSILKCRAVLMQHSEIKRLQWHPSDPDLLLIQCMQSESILYVWNAKDQQPQVLDMGDATFSSKVEAQWIHRTSRRRHTIAMGDAHSFVLAHPPHLKQPSPSSNASERSFDSTSQDGRSEDSVYEHLAGKTEDKTGNGKAMAESKADTKNEHGFVDDTFRWHNKQSIKSH